MSLQIYLAVAVGSALGGIARYAGSDIAASAFGDAFPWGTLIVNVTGSFFLGFFASLTAGEGNATSRQFVMAGLCGGFTTFSAFSQQTLNLMHNQEWTYAGLNVLGSVTLCVLAAWLGHMAAGAITQFKGA